MSQSRDAVLKARYLHPGEDTEEQLYQRVAKAWGTDARHREAMMDMMQNKRGFLNTPALANAGRESQMGSACYVLPVNDSLVDGESSIMQTLKDAAAVHKSGGGTGFNFSRLRGKGSLVRSTGRPAPGAVNALKLYSNAIEMVTQAGMRPGANMGVLNVDHPDIKEFIRCKQTEGSIHNFNISVAVTDEFMEKVAADTLDHHEQFVWDAIVEGAWRNGEPGILFIDTVNTASLHPEVIESTNPCLTGDTVIATVDGPRTFASLAAAGEDVDVFSWDPATKLPVVRTMRRPHLTQVDAPVLEVEFDSGLKVRCTYGHSFYTCRGEKIAASRLRVGQSVRAWSMSQHRDGHMRVHAWDSARNTAAHQWVHRMVWEQHHGPVPEGYVVHHIDHDPTNNALDNLELLSSYAHQSHHYPERLANGFTTRKSPEPAASFNHKVVAIRDAGIADVYNGCVDDSHTYIVLDPDAVAGEASGIVSANCGEVPLRPYEACVLGSINVASYVYDDGRQYDWTQFEQDIYTMVEALDNVIEWQDYPIEQIRTEQRRYRKIGLGVMGYADLLCEMGYEYGSVLALDVAARVMKFLQDTSYRASKALGVERGLYDGWKEGMPERRNLNCQVIAPTGSIARLAECSWGIEPHFDVDRHGNFQSFIVGGQFTDYNPYYIYHAFKPASMVTVEEHVDTQAAFQQFTDQAVSKTINGPYEMTLQDVEDAYVWAWESGCKGITILREGSREDVVIGQTAEAAVVGERECVGAACSI